jgi:hypothetical protein
MTDGPDPHADLVARLRKMRWPEAPPQVRERIWLALMLELDDLVAARDVLAPDELFDTPALGRKPHLSERRLRRHEFATPIAGGYTGALGVRVAAAARVTRPLAAV